VSSLAQRGREVVVLGGVVDDVARPKDPHLVVDAMEPVVGEVVGEEEQHVCPPLVIGSGVSSYRPVYTRSTTSFQTALMTTLPPPMVRLVRVSRASKPTKSSLPRYLNESSSITSSKTNAGIA
jgi:hypothetical protein